MRGKVVVFALCLVLVLSLAGCTPKQAAGTGGSPEVGPEEYFPTATGTRWEYDITLGEAEPLSFRTVSWPLGEDRAAIYATRGLFRGTFSGESKEFKLVLRVKGPAEKQGPLQYPLSVELEIEKDELGVFEDATQIFWAITSSGRYMVTEVVTYPSDSPGAPSGSWGMWGQEEGAALRVFFFGERPGIAIGVGKDSPDKLLFDGPEGSQLHFVREVEADEDGEHYLSSGFTEDMWFEEGRGLVRLEQKVGGKASMTWELVEFTSGTK